MAKAKIKNPVPKLLRDFQVYKTTHGINPGPESPLCKRCHLDLCNAQTPYMQFSGSENPDILLLFDSPSKKEDLQGTMGSDGPAKYLLKVIGEVSKGIDFDVSKIRYGATTRCAIVEGKGKPETGGKYCRNYLVQDLIDHPPKLIVPVGSIALKLLSHKGSAQDWGGKLLTYRGWPDDWLIDPQFETGHHIFGPRPASTRRIPMMPLQSPRMIVATRNPRVIRDWYAQVKKVVKTVTDGVIALSYDRPWWVTTNDPDEVERTLRWLIANPGLKVTYDTETTGLYPWFGDKIVYMMVRWVDPTTNQPKALGWPWEYTNADLRAKPELMEKFADCLEPSPMLPYIKRLSPLVLEALAGCLLRGHNLTFDIKFTAATLEGGMEWLSRLCQAFHEDTWHMRYALRQERGSRGLELIAYDWAPDFAGYEEEMSLLIERYRAIMHPEEGGHYANCPPALSKTHFRPYVMGDVEVCHLAAEAMEVRLESAKQYQIPLAHPVTRGKFFKYSPPGRAFVYSKILSPAGGVLAAMHGRGMFISQEELASQEELFPKLIFKARDDLRKSNQELSNWCAAMEAADPEWEFDLEKKDLLKTALFDVMGLPIKNLTDAGGKRFKSVEGVSREDLVKYASTDKFSVNSLAVDYPKVRPLLDYRSLHKQYTSYVRPMRNINTIGIDKKPRTSKQLMSWDSCVHCDFKLTGTRTGRLSASNPNLQNLPRDGVIKKLFISRFGARLGCIYQGDLSQIELRLLACACGDPLMVKAYHEGQDLHSLTTSNVFNIPYENFSESYEIWLQKNDRAKEAKELKGKRKIGKTLNFLTGYGGGAFGFQSALALQGVYLSLQECETHLENFFAAYPYLKTHIGYYKSFIQEHGLAVSMTGRVRILDEVFSDDMQASSKAMRAGYNHLIQSTASDIMLICLVAIERMMRGENLQSILVSTVHDSLVIDALRSELPVIHEIVNTVLQNIPEIMDTMLGPNPITKTIIVPLAGDCGVGASYHQELKLPKHLNIDWTEINQLMDREIKLAA